MNSLHPVEELAIRKNDVAKISTLTLMSNKASSERLAYEVEMFLAGTPVAATHMIADSNMPKTASEPRQIGSVANVQPSSEGLSVNALKVLESLQRGRIITQAHTVMNESLCHLTRSQIGDIVSTLRRRGYNIVPTKVHRGHAGFELIEASHESQ